MRRPRNKILRWRPPHCLRLARWWRLRLLVGAWRPICDGRRVSLSRVAFFRIGKVGCSRLLCCFWCRALLAQCVDESELKVLWVR